MSYRDLLKFASLFIYATLGTALLLTCATPEAFGNANFVDILFWMFFFWPEALLLFVVTAYAWGSDE